MKAGNKTEGVSVCLQERNDKVAEHAWENSHSINWEKMSVTYERSLVHLDSTSE